MNDGLSCKGGGGGRKKGGVGRLECPAAAVIDYVNASNLLIFVIEIPLNQPQRCRDHCKSLKVSQSRFSLSVPTTNHQLNQENTKGKFSQPQ